VTPPEVLAELNGLGYRLGLRPGGLRLTGKVAPTPEVLGLVRDHRAELMALLVEDAQDLREERAAILEYQAGLSREDAEHLAGLHTLGDAS
jgi:hypothetical protein